jgi:hypothetical protein
MVTGVFHKHSYNCNLFITYKVHIGLIFYPRFTKTTFKYSKAALSFLVAPVQLHRYTKIHASKAFATTCYSNTSCLGPTGCHHQVYKLPRFHAAIFSILKYKILTKYFISKLFLEYHTVIIFLSTCCGSGVGLC